MWSFGSVSAMLTILKNNKREKNTIFEIDNENNKVYTEKLELKKSSRAQIRKCKTEIESYKQNEFIRKIILLVLIIMIFTGIIIQWV